MKKGYTKNGKLISEITDNSKFNFFHDVFGRPEATIAPPNYAYQPTSSSLIGISFPYNFRWMRGRGFKTHWVSVTYQYHAYYCWFTIEVMGSRLIFSKTNKNGNKIHFILTTKQRVS